MSGFVGIINLDGEPIDPRLLERMTDALAFRGHDGRGTWIDGNVGFGHTLLITTDESAREKQPFSFDGKMWIVADARIDGRTELKDKLRAKDRDAQDATDVELILHAYCVWGDACVDHLMGDFSFAIWDNTTRSLFAAHDQWGVKSLYYALVKNCFVFSNTLRCIRLHPSVSERLDDLAIADFLLFENYQDQEATAFADIRRLPAGHRLSLTKSTVAIQRYWSLPVIHNALRYKRQSEYVEQFLDIFRTAISDYLRSADIGIWMSGGLDSTSVAAIGKEVLDARYSEARLQAYTVVYDELIPDHERYYADAASQALNIPVQFIVGDDHGLFEGWNDLSQAKTEPFHNPASGIQAELFRAIRDTGRHKIVLSGEGGDAALTPSLMIDLISRLPLQTFVGDVINSLRRGVRPKTGIIARWRKRKNQALAPSLPDWINRDFSLKFNLRDRLQDFSQTLSNPSKGAIRGEAYANLTSPLWSGFFKEQEPDYTLSPFSVCLPWLDLRLIEFLLAVPSLPWCDDKYLTRDAMRGRLPEKVRTRPKTPLQGDLTTELMRRSAQKYFTDVVLVEPLRNYVDIDILSSVVGNGKCYIMDGIITWEQLRPLSLNNWMYTLCH
jgi:asparagine synthase (glutamine-hydrolysing)